MEFDKNYTEESVSSRVSCTYLYTYLRSFFKEVIFQNYQKLHLKKKFLNLRSKDSAISGLNLKNLILLSQRDY